MKPNETAIDYRDRIGELAHLCMSSLNQQACYGVFVPVYVFRDAQGDPHVVSEREMQGVFMPRSWELATTIGGRMTYADAVKELKRHF